MQIDTPRLILRSLTAEETFLWAQDLPRFEERLGVKYDATLMWGEFQKIVLGQAEKAAADKENEVWHTFFMMIRKTDNVIIGSADFKAPPTPDGDVEIGYGIGINHEHHGYMTEACAALCKWAFEQPGVRRVIAETEKDNAPSQHVLARCGFTPLCENDTAWFELKK